MKRLLFVFSVFATVIFFPIPVYAQTGPITDSASVSATVIEQAIATLPVLISPANNSITINNFEPFIFKQATASSGISYYDLIIDGEVAAGNIWEGFTSQDAYFFTAHRTGDTFTINLKYPLADGLHHWYVHAVSAGGATGDSENWKFTVDHTIPQIILTDVDQNHLYWASNDPGTIPPEDRRHLSVSTNTPLIKGKVEAYSNLKISVVCPPDAPLICQSQSVTFNYPTGEWAHRLTTTLLPNVEYSVYLIAVDAAGNINNFPIFYITFGRVPTVTPSLSPSVSPPLTPSVSPIITPSLTISPPISPTIPPVVELGSYFRQPPPAPTLPPETRATPIPLFPIKTILPFILQLIFFGLLLHLLMTLYGGQIPLKNWPSFLFDLFLPFIKTKKYTALPFFTSITTFNIDDLSRQLSFSVSDVTGKYHLTITKELPKIFIRISRPGYETVKILPLKNESQLSLKLKRRDRVMAEERLQLFSLSTRIIPLIFADFTSLLVSLLAPSIASVTYFLISMIYTFSEYIYPRR